MQQRAWLHARPRDRKGKPGDQSRWARLEAAGKDIDLPDPGAAGYLVDWLFQVGPMESNGMGAVAVSWSEIQAWASTTAIPLRPWESVALRRCSQAYVAQLHEAEDPACPAPYVDPDAVVQHRAAVSSALGAFLSAKARQPPEPEKPSMRAGFQKRR